jgi:D-alanyl-D-alanine carboxypeptidase (penicillin-binding protein 5/6)
MSWAIHDLDTGDLLWSKQATELREMASLTKIMTLYACLEAAERFYIPLSSPVRVPRYAAWTIGTTACLREGDTISLEDLLYALMLPSGNDAANAIANFVGRAIITSPNVHQSRRRAAQAAPI